MTALNLRQSDSAPGRQSDLPNANPESGKSSPAPRCPRCRWYLHFEARDKSWEARCPNKRPPNPCPVEVVPASIDTDLAEWLRSRGEVHSTEVAEQFSTTMQNANNRLQALLRLGIVTRRRVDPVRGGKLFAWRLA